MGEAAVCPKCGGAMERGFVADFSHAATLLSTWVAGRPARSFWRGVRVPAGAAMPTATFRCVGCGYLESYARPEFAPE